MALWLTHLAGALWFAWRFARGLGAQLPAVEEVPATVVAPVKGAGPDLPDFVRRLRHLAYADYRVVAVVESDDDPAVPILRAGAAAPGGAAMEVLTAGLARARGQKVHNLLHALDRLDDRTEIVAFVDADTLPEPDWLTRLARPLLRDRTVAASTGHRWIVPRGDDLPSAVVAAAGASLLTLPRMWDIAWGGTLAMRRDTLDLLDLGTSLGGAVVDDCAITRLLRARGARIFTSRELVVRSPVEHSWSSAFAFARRQHMFVRFYLPAFRWTSLAALTLPVVAGASAVVLALSGDPAAAAVLAVAAALGQVRSILRDRIRDRLWGPAAGALPRRARRVERWMAPVWVTFHAAAAWSAGVSRHLRWAGVVYRVVGHNETRIVSRQPPPKAASRTT